MTKHDVRIRTHNVNVHCDHGIVERFNRTLSKRLFSYQSNKEMDIKFSERFRDWVKGLREVVKALNNDMTRSTGKRPVDAVRERVGWCQKCDSQRNECLFETSCFEGEKTWFFTECEISLCHWWTRSWWEASHGPKLVDGLIVNKGAAVLYYLEDGLGRGFVREELIVVPGMLSCHKL